MPNISLEKTLKTWKQELTPRRKAVTKWWEMKYQFSHKMKHKPPLITSKEVKQATTTESGPKTSRHAMKRRKKWSDRSSTKCSSKRTAHQKLGEGIRIKVTYNKEMWKKLVTTARFALCQRFTNCSQQSYTTDFTTDSTKRNQKTREDVDDLTKLWTILQHTDCWNRSAGSGVSKCGSRQWTSWRHLTQ